MIGLGTFFTMYITRVAHTVDLLNTLACGAAGRVDLSSKPQALPLDIPWPATPDADGPASRCPKLEKLPPKTLEKKSSVPGSVRADNQ